jgi:hypothetical protein
MLHAWRNQRTDEHYITIHQYAYSLRTYYSEVLAVIMNHSPILADRIQSLETKKTDLIFANTKTEDEHRQQRESRGCRRPS